MHVVDQWGVIIGFIACVLLVSLKVGCAHHSYSNFELIRLKQILLCVGRVLTWRLKV